MSKKFNTILIDGDVVLYKVGYATEKRWHVVGNPDNFPEYLFRHKKEAKEFIGSNPELELEIKGVSQEALPLPIAKKIVDSTIEAICNDLGTEIYQVYLSPSLCFRNRLCELYKANRKDTIRPYHYQSLKQHLIDKHGAVIQEDIEADDALGINRTEDSVIASIDKDLLMLPGYHFNITTRELCFSEDPGRVWLETRSGKKNLKGYGAKWFWAQMLLGDAVDNIFGIKGIGPVKVCSLFANHDLPKLEQIVRECYKKAGRSSRDFEKNMRLLWILRSPEQQFQSPSSLCFHIHQALTRTGSDQKMEQSISPTKGRSSEKT